MQTATAKNLLILGDSLSAGYQLSVQNSWASLLAERWKKDPSGVQIINASISGDTAAQGLARLPALLEQYKPDWVLIELGANDGLRGFMPQDIEQELVKIITAVHNTGAKPLLMQIRIPPNYGKRYSDAFSAIYPRLAEQYKIQLIPFYMEKVVIKPEWMLQDGLHPNADAQPFIADWMDNQLKNAITQ